MISVKDARKAGIAFRKSLSHKERYTKNARIFMHLQHLLRRLTPSNLAIYCSTAEEPTIHAIVSQCRALQHRLLLPRIMDFETSRMEFFPYRGRFALRNNRWRIAEPVAQVTGTGVELDIIFVPMTAFDTNGNRVGMGAGYYDKYLGDKYLGDKYLGDKYLGDRYLSSAVEPIKIGVAYRGQQSTKPISSASHDIPMDYILTEVGLEELYRRKSTQRQRPVNPSR